jgi:hypothetical protein
MTRPRTFRSKAHRPIAIREARGVTTAMTGRRDAMTGHRDAMTGHRDAMTGHRDAMTGRGV